MAALGRRGSVFLASFSEFWGRRAARHPVFAFRGRTSPLELGDALEVIAEIGHADLIRPRAMPIMRMKRPMRRPGPRHVLDCRAEGGALRVGPGDVLMQQPARQAPLVNVALEDTPLKARLVLLRAI